MRDPWPQRIVAAVSAVGAGAATAWFPEAQLPLIAVVVVAAAVIVFVAPRGGLAIVIAGTVLGAVAVQVPRGTFDAALQGVVFGLWIAFCLAVPLGVAAMVRQRRTFQRRGWKLAAAEEQRRSTEVRAALQRERMTVAAEMHDGIGHSLTLIAVRLGQLSLRPSLTDEDRAEIADIRHLSAETAEELGLAVQLLRQRPAAAADLGEPTVDSALANARGAGLHVCADVPDGFEDDLAPEVSRAVARMVQEGLTNAAKHAPDAPVSVSISRSDERVRVTISNPQPAEPVAAAPGGFGLVGLRHRAELLGGTLDVDDTDEFRLTLELPSRARPSGTSQPTPPGDVVAAEHVAARDAARATRAAIVVPAAILAAVAFVAVAYIVLSNTLSILSRADFDAVHAGQDRATVESGLPPLQMLDPPRDDAPAQSGEECRYYESRVSFFEREDVFVVCFVGDRVSRTTTVLGS